MVQVWPRGALVYVPPTENPNLEQREPIGNKVTALVGPSDQIVVPAPPAGILRHVICAEGFNVNGVVFNEDTVAADVLLKIAGTQYQPAFNVSPDSNNEPQANAALLPGEALTAALAVAITTNPVNVAFAWIDELLENFGTQRGSIPNTSPREIVAAPPAGVTRSLWTGEESGGAESTFVWNKDSIAHDFYLVINDNGTRRRIRKRNIAAGSVGGFTEQLVVIGENQSFEIEMVVGVSSNAPVFVSVWRNNIAE